MCKRLALAMLMLLLVAGTTAAAELSATEDRWLQAGWPVLRETQAQGLVIDIVVQPRPRPGDVPFAMAYVEGRCKLVLSMRGRTDDEAEAPLRGVPAELQASVIEAITAHEVAHCWRHVQGGWLSLPAGFVDGEPLAAGDDEAARAAQVRREEGFADLVGLAWTASRHRADYARVHAWLTALRGEPALPGSPHDTGVWLLEAGQAAAFDARAGSTPFEAAWPLWLRGLPR